MSETMFWRLWRRFVLLLPFDGFIEWRRTGFCFHDHGVFFFVDRVIKWEVHEFRSARLP